VITRTSILVAALAFTLAGCSLTQIVPNMDEGSAGCQRATGIGPIAGPNQNQAHEIGQGVMPELHGKTPAQAKAIAGAQGHTVVFNVRGTCWCVPPMGGKVTDSWWGQHGALWLMVDDFTPPEGNPPFLGWGC
jgi:hypothetical protein